MPTETEWILLAGHLAGMGFMAALNIRLARRNRRLQQKIDDLTGAGR